MSEYDSNYVYVPLEELQEMRHLQGRVSSIQIKLKPGAYERSSEEVKKALVTMFARDGLIVNTWEDKQGPLLSAISVEKGILNILLFLIIAVAGFGILAIFSMIVAEKTRDIGILEGPRSVQRRRHEDLSGLRPAAWACRCRAGQHGRRLADAADQRGGTIPDQDDGPGTL